MPKYETTLTASETVAEGTMAFRFAKPADFEFEPGHSVNVSLIDPPETDHKGNSRSFSLVSAPYETELVIATRIRDTAFKRSLKAMPAGVRAVQREFTRRSPQTDAAACRHRLQRALERRVPYAGHGVQALVEGDAGRRPH